MGKQTAEVELKVTGEQKAQSKIKRFTAFLKSKLVVTLGDVVRAFKFATQAIASFIAQGIKTIQVERAFARLTRSHNLNTTELLKSLEKAAAGTVSSYDLMEKANKGLLLTAGLVGDKMPKLLEIARASAKATGQDVGFMFDSIITGIGRGSPLILDNLGLTVKLSEAYGDYAKTLGISTEELTKAQQQQALLNDVLRSGEKLIDQTTGGMDDITDSYQQLSAAIKDFTDEQGKGLTRIFAPVAKFLAKVVRRTKAVIKARVGAEKEATKEIKDEATERELAIGRENLARVKAFQEANEKIVELNKSLSDELLAGERSWSKVYGNELKKRLGAYIDTWAAAQIAANVLNPYAIAAILVAQTTGKSVLGGIQFAQGGQFESRTTTGQRAVANEGPGIERVTVEPVGRPEETAQTMNANITIQFGNKELKTIATELQPYLNAKTRRVF